MGKSKREGDDVGPTYDIIKTHLPSDDPRSLLSVNGRNGRRGLFESKETYPHFVFSRPYQESAIVQLPCRVNLVNGLRHILTQSFHVTLVGRTSFMQSYFVR